MEDKIHQITITVILVSRYKNIFDSPSGKDTNVSPVKLKMIKDEEKINIP